MNSLENQILQIITQYINYKLSIDYKFELLLYNLDLLMAPIPVRLALRELDSTTSSLTPSLSGLL